MLQHSSSETRRIDGSLVGASDDDAARSAAIGSSHEINWPRWFVIIGALIGLATVLIVPPMRGIDEFSHVVRTSTINSGFLVPPPSKADPPDYRVDGCLEALRASGLDWARSDQRFAWGHQFDRIRCAEPQRLNGSAGTSQIANTEVNPPLAYLPAAVGLRIGRSVGGPIWGMYLARIAQLAAYLTLVWLALRLLPFGRPFLVAVALIPAAIQTAATVSADPVSVGLALLVTAATLRLIYRANHGGPAASNLELGGYCISLVLLATCKTAVLPIIAIALLVPTASFGSLRRRVSTLALTFGVAVAFAATWSIAVVSHIRIAMFNGADSFAMRQWIAAHPVDFAIAALRGWTDTWWIHIALSSLLTSAIVPNQSLWLVLGLGVAIALAYFSDLPASTVGRFGGRGSTQSSVAVDRGSVAHRNSHPEGRESKRRLRWPVMQRSQLIAVSLVAGIAFVGFWLIELGVAISVVAPGSSKILGVQGRYFIPYLPLLLFVSTRWTTGRKVVRPVASIVPVVFLVGLNLWGLSVVYRMYYVW